MGRALTDAEAEAFRRDGYLVLPGFYDLARDIDPIRRGVYDIIGLVAVEHGIKLNREPYTPATFDDGYLELKRHDRRIGGIVYDAVKQLAAFARLAAHRDNEVAFASLRGATTVGLAGGGSGIRIDNPDETKYLAFWHQEYPAQFRSLNGIVFWSPLRDVTPALGPVQILVGSHRDGVHPVVRDTQDGRRDAYALRLAAEHEIVARFPVVAPLAAPADLVLLDFLTVHRSGVNVADVPRWTMQLRLFDFGEPTGRSIGWAGSFAAGNSVAAVHPELEAEA